MSVDFGMVRKTEFSPNGSTQSKVTKQYRGETVKAVTCYRVRVKVVGSKEEVAQYLSFTDDLKKLRTQNKLYMDVKDAWAIPSFIIEYPTNDFDGSYFIIKCWAEKD